MAYSIEVALKSGLFDEVMVSTDDEEIIGNCPAIWCSSTFCPYGNYGE